MISSHSLHDAYQMFILPNERIQGIQNRYIGSIPVTSVQCAILNRDGIHLERMSFYLFVPMIDRPLIKLSTRHQVEEFLQGFADLVTAAPLHPDRSRSYRGGLSAARWFVEVCPSAVGVQHNTTPPHPTGTDALRFHVL
jgi:hypothetical protein